jgi:hypothetical protein
MQEVRWSAEPDLSSVLPLLLKDLDGSQSTPQDITTPLRRRERVTSRARAALEKSHTVPLSLEGSPETVPPLPVQNPRRRPRVPQEHRHILQTLNWAVGHLTVNAFLRLALSEELSDPGVRSLFLVHNDEGHGESD